MTKFPSVRATSSGHSVWVGDSFQYPHGVRSMASGTGQAESRRAGGSYKGVCFRRRNATAAQGSLGLRNSQHGCRVQLKTGTVPGAWPAMQSLLGKCAAGSQLLCRKKWSLGTKGLTTRAVKARLLAQTSAVKLQDDLALSIARVLAKRRLVCPSWLCSLLPTAQRTVQRQVCAPSSVPGF